MKQYLAVESAAPIHGEEVERGFLGESAEREAEYLVDEGSQLVRDQLRIAGDGTGEGVQWRTVSVRERTIQGMSASLSSFVGMLSVRRDVDTRTIMDIPDPSSKDLAG